MSFSAWFIPLLITGLFSWGLCSGVDVFDCFLQGAKVQFTRDYTG